MRAQTIRPVYVEFMPKTLDDGVLYISKKYRTASHRCCCGCGTRIVTPLRETEYRLMENGDRISLDPSIGNWNHPCQSHYWIKDNRVLWSWTMTRPEIERGRAYDDALKDAYFERPKERPPQSWWSRAWDALKRLLA